MTIKNLFKQVGLILAVSCVLGLTVNVGLVKKYFRGDFEHTFIPLEEYTSITYITIGEAEEIFAQGTAQFIDSRPAEQYQEGHIFGAESVPYEQKEKIHDLTIPFEKTLVIYCDGDECQSSINLALYLHENGFLDIRIFFGGWLEWRNAGLPESVKDDKK
jgi:rhodanese-related sulfurtransferase